MDERKELILNIILSDYIASGQPVASSAMVEKHALPFSPATVRNEMAELEEEGWIMQPYTSAGRIPTEKAFVRYIATLERKPLSKREAAILEEPTEPNSDIEALGKHSAKKLAHLSNLAVVWAFHKNHVYYTGISNLLQQPEFTTPHLVYDISAIIDRIDEIVGDIFESVAFEPKIAIGQDCPFGSFSGTVMSRFKSGGQTGLVALIGPLRMDYEKNLARLEHVINLMKA